MSEDLHVDFTICWSNLILQAFEHAASTCFKQLLSVQTWTSDIRGTGLMANMTINRRPTQKIEDGQKMSACNYKPVPLQVQDVVRFNTVAKFKQQMEKTTGIKADEQVWWRCILNDKGYCCPCSLLKDTGYIHEQAEWDHLDDGFSGCKLTLYLAVKSVYSILSTVCFVLAWLMFWHLSPSSSWWSLCLTNHQDCVLLNPAHTRTCKTANVTPQCNFRKGQNACRIHSQ